MARFAMTSLMGALLLAGPAPGDQYETDPNQIVWDPQGCGVQPEPGPPTYTTIQQAIASAPPDRQTRIEVRCGTWQGPIDFGGKPIVLYAIDGPDRTTIEGDGTGPAVVFADGETSDSAIIGFTISGGGDVAGSHGGGIAIDGASPAIIGCQIVQNSALLGAGIYVRNGNPIILNTTIRANIASTFGGGIYLESASPQIINCSIVDNECWKSDNGGAVRAFARSDAQIVNSITYVNYPDDFSVDATSTLNASFCVLGLPWAGPGSNNIFGDPGFIDYASGDLRLLPTSPAIDSAALGALPPDPFDLDLDGDLDELTPLDGYLRLRLWDAARWPPALPPPLDRGAREWNDQDIGDVTPARRSELAQELWPFERDGRTVHLGYTSTTDLFQDNPAIRRVIFSIPAAGRGGINPIEAILGPVVDEGLARETLIIAPQFLEDMDIACGGYGFNTTDILYWGANQDGVARGFNGGGESDDGIADGPPPPFGAFGPRGTVVPSFTLLDDMIRHIVESQHFLNLEQLIVVGFSGGGQFTNRYSFSSPIEDTVVRPAGIDMRYVPTSPGSLMCPSPLRPADPDQIDLRRAVYSTFGTSLLADCGADEDTYDQWPYGLSGNFYLYHQETLGGTAEEIAARMRAQYERREVTVLVDACDDGEASPLLPQSGPDCLMGNTRLKRAQNFFAGVVATYGPQILSRQRLAISEFQLNDPKCGSDEGRHDHYPLYDSRLGRRWLLDVPAPPEAGAGDDVPPNRVIRVDPDSTAVPDGRTWPTAFHDLQDGLLATAAWGGDVTRVWVAEGTYRPDRGTGDRTMSFPILRDAAILGGFSGVESYDYERDPQAHLCILSGDLAGDSPGRMDDDAFHVVTGHLIDRSRHLGDLFIQVPIGEDPKVYRDMTGALEGFTVRHGNADPTGAPPFSYSALDPYARGGGIYVLRGAPIIQACTIEQCHAYNGGGISSEGCLAADDSFPCLLDVLFERVEGARIVDCEVENNAALLNGGGLYLYSSKPVVLGTRIRDNVAGVAGGGIGAFGPHGETLPRLDGCMITGNDGGERGGGMIVDTDGIVVSNTLIRGNLATESGGGIRTTLEKLAESYFANVTVVDNHVVLGGQGSGVHAAGMGLTLIDNGVFAENTGSAADIEGDAVTVNYTRADHLYPGLGNIDDDPGFVDAPGHDYRLAAGSPCIDAASSPSVPADAPDVDDDRDRTEPAPFDLDRNPRFRDDPGTVDTGVPGTSFPEVVDMGAYEFQTGTPLAGDLDGDGDVDGADLGILLGSWGGPGADLDGNGTTDGADLGIVLGQWT